MFIRNQKDALIYEFINKLKNIVSYNIESSHAPSLHFLLKSSYVSKMKDSKTFLLCLSKHSIPSHILEPIILKLCIGPYFTDMLTC